MKKISASIIAAGGQEVPVQLSDGSESSIKVRLLKVVEFPKYFLRLAGNENALAEFLCDQAEGWAASLAPGSLVEVVDTGHDLNFEAARRWAEWRAKIEADAAPLMGTPPAPATPTPSAT